jgi:hypothetical protein
MYTHNTSGRNSNCCEIFITPVIKIANWNIGVDWRIFKRGPSHNCGCYPPASHRGCLGSIQSQIKWDFCWTKWHWGGFSRSISISSANSHSISCSTFVKHYTIWGYVVSILTVKLNRKSYLPLTLHWSHKKRSLLQFFIAAGIYLPSCFLATVGRYKNRPTDTSIQYIFCCCIYLLPRERVYRAAA